MNNQQKALKASIEKHKKRIEDSRKTIEGIREKLCDHIYVYGGVIDLEDYEICKICGKLNKLPKELLGIDYGQDKK